MKEMKELKRKCLDCRLCSIGGCSYDGGIGNVFSNMNTEADIMVVGQNPGYSEVACAKPMMGRSGLFFMDSMKKICGIERSDLYMTNVVKCVIPSEFRGNSKPYRSEIDNCQSFLDKEIELVKPKVIISLGAIPLKSLTGMSGIKKHHGTIVYSVRYKTEVIALMSPNPFMEERKGDLVSGLQNFNKHLDKIGFKRG